ncbi:response regulator transcription factor [Janthinobacterium sp.]|uniref:response regulator transcription factor n=1 Tax=Janthinobacterium sp. TaxID=1871054 RepID=UPI00289F124A|nr:response regulator transcription factor [Janthinobacterium sp.]
MSAAVLTVLLIEDHAGIARQIATFVDGLGWQLDHAGTGALGVRLATSHVYDVVLLDLNLPDIDGLQVCRAIKAGAPSNVPILMLTARDAYEDKARGFHDGADDYLTKPFDLRELALRCEALARRSQLHVHQELRVGPFMLLARESRAHYRDVALSLTQSGFKILMLLCREHPHAVARAALSAHLWGSEPPESDALKSHIYALRKQLEAAGGAGLLVTIPQLGYRLALADEKG